MASALFVTLEKWRSRWISHTVLYVSVAYCTSFCLCIHFFILCIVYWTRSIALHISLNDWCYINTCLCFQGDQSCRRSALLKDDNLLEFYYEDTKTAYDMFQRGLRIAGVCDAQANTTTVSLVLFEKPENSLCNYTEKHFEWLFQFL